MKFRTKVIVASTIVAIFAIYAYAKIFRIHGFIMALEPVDGAQAIVLVRANEEYGRGPRAWVGLRNATGGWVWSKRLAGLPVIGARNGLLVAGDLAIVRTEGVTTAYAIETGEQRWQTPIGGEWPATTIDLVAAGPRVFEGSSVGGESSLAALDRQTGAVLWSRSIDPLTQGLQAHDDAAVLRGLVATPESPGVFVADGAVCLEKGEYVYFDGKRIMARPFRGEARVVVPELTLSNWNARSIRCGRYGDRLVFTLSLMRERESEVGLLEIEGGAQRAFTPLGLGYRDVSLIDQQVTDWRFPENAPLNGTIPRFVPLVVPAKEHEYQFALLDMEERRVVKRGPSQPRWLFTVIHQQGDVFYVHSERSVIGRIDGKTGTLTAAVRLPNLDPLRPFHVKAGRIWLYRNEWFDNLPYAVLDAETLKPVAKSGPMTIEDVPSTGWFE